MLIIKKKTRKQKIEFCLFIFGWANGLSFHHIVIRLYIRKKIRRPRLYIILLRHRCIRICFIFRNSSGCFYSSLIKHFFMNNEHSRNYEYVLLSSHMMTNARKQTWRKEIMRNKRLTKCLWRNVLDLTQHGLFWLF